MKRAAQFWYLLLAVSALSALAQTTGTVNGTVLDGQGAALPGAELVLTNVATGQTRQLTSSSEGYFLFGEIPGLNTWCGAALIIAAAFFITIREQQLASARTRARIAANTSKDVQR